MSETSSPLIRHSKPKGLSPEERQQKILEIVEHIDGVCSAQSQMMAYAFNKKQLKWAEDRSLEIEKPHILDVSRLLMEIGGVEIPLEGAPDTTPETVRLIGWGGMSMEDPTKQLWLIEKDHQTAQLTSPFYEVVQDLWSVATQVHRSSP